MNDRFLGAKSASGAYQVIIAAMPPHDTYIESHLGTGAVLQRKPAAVRSIGIDRDSTAIQAYPRGQDVELYEGDCKVFLRDFDYSGAGRVLIYHDPPYLLTTRTSRRRYRYDYTDGDHLELLSLIRRLPALQLVSGYPSALYDEQLVGWRSLEFQVMSRGGVRTEKLWMNYDPSAAHWVTYAGRNFTDRQRIKRKAARWADHYTRLPAGERLAVLASLLEAHVSSTQSPTSAPVYAAGGIDEAVCGGRARRRRL